MTRVPSKPSIDDRESQNLSTNLKYYYSHKRVLSEGALAAVPLKSELTLRLAVSFVHEVSRSMSPDVEGLGWPIEKGGSM